MTPKKIATALLAVSIGLSMTTPTTASALKINMQTENLTKAEKFAWYDTKPKTIPDEPISDELPASTNLKTQHVLDIKKSTKLYKTYRPKQGLKNESGKVKAGTTVKATIAYYDKTKKATYYRISSGEHKGLWLNGKKTDHEYVRVGEFKKTTEKRFDHRRHTVTSDTTLLKYPGEFTTYPNRERVAVIIDFLKLNDVVEVLGSQQVNGVKYAFVKTTNESYGFIKESKLKDVVNGSSFTYKEPVYVEVPTGLGLAITNAKGKDDFVYVLDMLDSTKIPVYKKMYYEGQFYLLTTTQDEDGYGWFNAKLVK